MKKSVLICLLIIAGIVTISGCTSDSESESSTILKPGYGVIGATEFKLEPGWTQPEESANFNYDIGQKLWMRVDVYQNKADYDEDYELSNQPNSQWVVESQSNEKIGDINTKTLSIVRKDGTEAGKEYFFEKNSKYYHVIITAFNETSNSKIAFENSKGIVDSTIETLVNTIR